MDVMEPGAAIGRDIAAGEAVERELDAFIARRAKNAEKATAEEMLWKASVRRHHKATRRENRAAWFAHFCRMADNRAALAADYERRADELCESEPTKGARPSWPQTPQRY